MQPSDFELRIADCGFGKQLAVPKSEFRNPNSRLSPGAWMLVLFLFVSPSLLAQGVAVGTAEDGLRINFSGLLDVEGYQVSKPPGGLLYGTDGSLFNPRLTAFVDLWLGKRVYGLAQIRTDRGFDPLSRSSDLRVDEYFLRYTPFRNGRLNLQAGKSATLVGNWVARHYSWENPFVTAPLPYENITIIWDRWQPSDAESFLGYLDKPDRKEDMLPVIWGPAYTAGFSAFGTAGRWDYGIEFKNAGLSSRPSDWDPRNVDWRRPTVSGRIGHRPNPAWNLGVSFSRGHYMNGDPDRTLLEGARLGDFHQTVIGHDLSYAHGHLQLWGEVYLSRFGVQRLGELSTAAYYVEAKYKVTPQFFTAFRWGQQFFENVAGRPWDGRASRGEFAVGYRFNQRIQGKIQLGLTSEDRPAPQGRHFTAAQLTFRF